MKFNVCKKVKEYLKTCKKKRIYKTIITYRCEKWKMNGIWYDRVAQDSPEMNIWEEGSGRFLDSETADGII